MPTETISPDLFTIEPEARETEITPEEFCEAFRDVSNLQRHAIAGLLHVTPGILTSGALAKHTDRHSAPKVIRKIEMLVNSEQLTHHIEQCIENGNYPDLLNDEQMRSYILGLAKSGLVGGLASGLLNAGVIPNYDKRSYMASLLDMGHGYKNLVDSDFGRSLSLNRYQLGSIIGEAFGAAYDQDSRRDASWIEMGIAAEVATKRYVEEIGPQYEIGVRYGTAEEDAKKVDIVCFQGRKLLGVDIKSGDKNSGSGGEVRAWRSPIEQRDVNEYRVRELYPAVESCIGQNFEINAEAYKRVIRDLLEEFDSLG